MRVVPVSGVHEKCAHCLIIIGHLKRSRAVVELRACGISVEFSETGPATHFYYPDTDGPMSNNASPICEGHTLLYQGIDEFGSLNAYIDSLRQRDAQLKVLAEIDLARARELE